MKKSSALFTLLVVIHTVIQSYNHTTMAQTTRKAFINGKIYTVNEQQPYAEMVMTEGNKITYVGKTNLNIH